MALLISLGFVQAASPVIKVLDPNGGEAIESGTTYSIDFNVQDADSDELLVSLYYTEYSEGSGSNQYPIIKDFNATNSVNCPNYSDSATEYTCTYDWNLLKPSTNLLSSGIVTYFPLDSNTNAEGYVVDFSNNDLNAVDSNATDLNTSDCLDGNCWRFDYEGYYGKKGSLKVSKVNVSYEEGTFAGWFKADDWTAINNFINYYNQNDITYSSISIGTNGGNLRGIIYDGDKLIKCEITYDVSALTDWHHVAFTWKNNGRCYIYLDGVEVTEGLVTDANMNFAPLFDLKIGFNSSFTYKVGFNGNADEIKVYSRQLSETEVMTDYNRLKVSDGKYFLDATVIDNYGGTETTDSSDGEFLIGSGTITVNVPKDEKTLESISSFDIRVIGTLSQDFNGLTSSQEVVVTLDEDYRVIVDSNSEGYYQRNYYVKLTESNPTTTIQPYLADQNNGLLTWMYLIDPNTNQRIPDILIKVLKSISGEGTTEVESIKTDSSGAANLAFIALDTYTIEYYQDGTLLKTDTLNPSSTTYYSYIDTGEVTIPDMNMSIINVTFTPNRYLSPPSEDANISFDVNISIETGDGNAVWIYARQIDRIVYSLYDNNAVWDGKDYAIDINQTDLNAWIPLRVQVVISTTKQTSSFYKTFEVIKTGEHEWKIDIAAAGFLSEVGYMGGILVALFTYLAIMIGATRWLQVNAAGGAAIGAAVFGIFTYLGFIPIWIFAIVGVIAIVTWMISR